jgi:hypothetical protein
MRRLGVLLARDFDPGFEAATSLSSAFAREIRAFQSFLKLLK